MTFKPVLKIITDYPRDDLAHDEVRQALVTACLQHGVNPFDADVGSVNGMDTVAAGFKTAQLALNSRIGFGHIFHTNCAPRKNIISARSQGEKIVLGMTKTGVAVLIVNSGYALSPFRASVEQGDMVFFQTSVPDEGSQFRSRDFFPAALAELAAHLGKCSDAEEKLAANDIPGILNGLPWLEDPLDLVAIPVLPSGSVYHVDNFGNIKLNILHKDLRRHYVAGETLAVKMGHVVCGADVGEAGFSQGEGMLALTSGSSGWPLAGEKNFFTEVFLRGSSAAGRFDGVLPGMQALMLREEDLKSVIDILRSVDRETAEQLDLYELSEAKVIKVLAQKNLIKDGYNTTALQDCLAAGNLLEKLV